MSRRRRWLGERGTGRAEGQGFALFQIVEFVDEFHDLQASFNARMAAECGHPDLSLAQR